jgi:hypothetical protein
MKNSAVINSAAIARMLAYAGSGRDINRKSEAVSNTT